MNTVHRCALKPYHWYTCAPCRARPSGVVPRNHRFVLDYNSTYVKNIRGRRYTAIRTNRKERVQADTGSVEAAAAAAAADTGARPRHLLLAVGLGGILTLANWLCGSKQQRQKATRNQPRFSTRCFLTVRKQPIKRPQRGGVCYTHLCST